MAEAVAEICAVNTAHTFIGHHRHRKVCVISSLWLSWRIFRFNHFSILLGVLDSGALQPQRVRPTDLPPVDAVEKLSCVAFNQETGITHSLLSVSFSDYYATCCKSSKQSDETIW